MEQNMFDELMASVQEMDQIVKDEKLVSRRFDFPDREVNLIRDRTET